MTVESCQNKIKFIFERKLKVTLNTKNSTSLFKIHPYLAGKIPKFSYFIPKISFSVMEK